MFVSCATNKDPVWSEYYYPQEVLLKPAPKAESSRVQGKSTFLQNEAEFKISRREWNQHVGFSRKPKKMIMKKLILCVLFESLAPSRHLN